MARAALVLLVLMTIAAAGSRPIPATARQRAAPSTHPERVLIFAFDNTHLDDLQAIPALWDFLQAGAWSTNHHTVAPPRSAPGFAAIASGRYADRTGILDNSFFA